MGGGMSDWRVVKMSAAEVANGRHIQLQRDFGMIFYTIGAPRDVALFSRRPWGKVPAPFLELYFSPASVLPCASLIAAHAGQPATKPPREEATSLVVGHQGAWDSLLS
jgi:hypothetical protein